MVTVECLCPPNAAGEVRHPDGDTITLRERLDFRAAATVRLRINAALQETLIEQEITAIIIETYVLVGVSEWSVVDEKNEPLPPSRENITERLLGNIDMAMIVGNAAAELYNPVVFDPLVKRALKSSPPTPIDASTSARATASVTPSKRSKPSSITTIPTDATETTLRSLAGASS